MKFVELTDILNKLPDVEMDLPTCVDPNQPGYSLLQAQMQGSMLYSITSGVSVQGDAHDPLCRSLIKLVRKNNTDLVLFPEYCISYKLLREIIISKELWPENRKLWVLPCQGISLDDFRLFLKECKDSQSICLIEDACDERNMNPKKFVNALFYCFRVYQVEENQCKLCLVPQLKTHAMGDKRCVCELPGMCTGNIIYTINHRLITLLCADSLNNELTWAALQKDHQNQGMIILHPQMNAHPKNEVFLRLLREIGDHAQQSIYITCNWTFGTDASPDSGEQGQRIEIDLSWSCIYRKHADSFKEEWLKDCELRDHNSKHGLWGAIIPLEKMELWYCDSPMHALIINMPNLTPHGFGNTQLSQIRANQYYVYHPESQVWSEERCALSTLQQRICGTNNEYIIKQSRAVAKPYRYPLDFPNKYEVDQFWNLTISNQSRNSLIMNSISASPMWTLLLDKQDLEQARKEIGKLWHLIHILMEPKNFPSRFSKFSAEHEFCFIPSKNGEPCANLRAGQLQMIVALAEDEIEAARYVKHLKRSECYNNSDLVQRTVGVFYRDPISDQICMAPDITPDITCGDHAALKGDITNGGH